MPSVWFDSSISFDSANSPLKITLPSLLLLVRVVDDSETGDSFSDKEGGFDNSSKFSLVGFQ